MCSPSSANVYRQWSSHCIAVVFSWSIVRVRACSPVNTVSTVGLRPILDHVCVHIYSLNIVLLCESAWIYIPYFGQFWQHDQIQGTVSISLYLTTRFVKHAKSIIVLLHGLFCLLTLLVMLVSDSYQRRSALNHGFALLLEIECLYVDILLCSVLMPLLLTLAKNIHLFIHSFIQSSRHLFSSVA